MSEPASEQIDRRPIRSRNTVWAERVTLWLAGCGVSPNAISILGMLAALSAGVSFWLTDTVDGPLHRILWFAGSVMCQIRLLCNLFDGMVAIKRGIASRRGELFNEVPDRVSDAAVFIGLGYSSGGDVTLGYIAALISVFVAYVRAAARSLGAPNDFCGPMAKPQRMAIVTGLAVYMALSPATWHLSWGEPSMVLAIVVIGGIVTAIRRLVRATRYLEGQVK